MTDLGRPMRWLSVVNDYTHKQLSTALDVRGKWSLIGACVVANENRILSASVLTSVELTVTESFWKLEWSGGKRTKKKNEVTVFVLFFGC